MIATSIKEDEIDILSITFDLEYSIAYRLQKDVNKIDTFLN